MRLLLATDLHFSKYARRAFSRQRGSARKRGIEFNFTLEEWVAWWQEKLGDDWESLRGKGVGKYCMARFRDRGPYASHNVKCSRFEDNIREIEFSTAEIARRAAYGRKAFASKKVDLNGVKHHKAKLDDKLAREIFLAKGKNKDIAKRFGVNPNNIHYIKKRRIWKDATKHLKPRYRVRIP